MRRFSIATLMLIVLVCAIGIAALVNASETWAGVMTCVTLLLLAASLLAIPYRREGCRAFWLGFAVFGWGYVLLVHGPTSDSLRLPTEDLLNLLYGRMNPVKMDSLSMPLPQITDPRTSPNPPGGPLSEPPGTFPSLPGLKMTDVNRPQFVRVGHCLFTLLVALVGGGIAVWFHRTNPNGG